HIAALGDAMTRLAGELADAWMPFLYPWSQLAIGVERLREGATRGGHPDRLPEIHPCVPAIVAHTDAKAREGAAWFVSLFVRTSASTATRSRDRATARPWMRCSRPTRRSSRASFQPMRKNYSSN